MEVFTTLPLREMLALVESFYFTDLRVTYRGEWAVFQGAEAIHKRVLEDHAPKTRLFFAQPAVRNF